MTYRVHLIEFTGGSGEPYKILHAADCDRPADCYYDFAASHARLGQFPKPPGRYYCSINWSNLLEVHGQVPDRFDQLATIEEPWTMGDLRAWIGRWSHIPDDYVPQAHVPQRPRSWAHDGSPLYTNTLHGLQVDDPEDFE
jgi:hypothetical protein